MKEQNTRVVVADGARAKFLVKHNDSLMPIMLTHHAVDDVTIHQDKSASTLGRVSKGMTTQGLHSYPTHSDWHHFKKEEFATEIAKILHSTVLDYDRLILIAAPVVLGCLRQHLSQLVACKVVQEINKDLTKAPLKEVMSYI